MGVGGRRRPPLSHVSSEEGGCWWVGWQKNPSASLFEQGRGGGGLLEGDNPLRLEMRGRGDGSGFAGNSPLCLAQNARKGDGDGFEGHKAPSVSHFEQGRAGGPSKQIVCR